MQIIKTKKDLEVSCARLADHDFLTIDTEFMRENTFWPKLCLIQMASPVEEFIIDPLSQQLDLAPFFDLMADKSILKVFHAARQDIEIVHHLAKIIPEPLFDTQVAAMVCGFGDSVGYSMLVKKLLKRDLDKTSRFTDWSRRPLSLNQINYALADVTHLREIYPKLALKLEQSDRISWLAEEMAILSNPSTYENKPEEAWRRLKMRVKNGKSLGVMMEIAEWRDREAQNQNVPRARIIKDDAIYDIANQAPQTVEQLLSLRTINAGFGRSYRGQKIIDAVERGLARKEESLPPVAKGEPLPPEKAAIVDLLRIFLKATAGRYDVAPKLIATTDDLEKIALSDEAPVPALQGWRRDLFGLDALNLKHGKLALAIEKGTVTVIKK